MPSNDTPTQLEFFTVPSPCIGVCQSGPKGYCVGCFRSRDERLYWLQVDDGTKRQIITACQRRKRASLRKKRVDDSAQGLPVQADMFDSSQHKS